MKKINTSSGQALVMLLFITLMALTVIASAAVVVNGNISSASVNEQGNYAYSIAESGVEEALIRMLRDPNYSGSGATPMSMNDGTVMIVVSGGVITSTGTYGKSVRKIQAQTVYNNNTLTISSWKEI
jgi:hypothetical protein